MSIVTGDKNIKDGQRVKVGFANGISISGRFCEGLTDDWFCILAKDDDGAIYSQFKDIAIRDDFNEGAYCSVMLSFDDPNVLKIDTQEQMAVKTFNQSKHRSWDIKDPWMCKVKEKTVKRSSASNTKTTQTEMDREKIQIGDEVAVTFVDGNKVTGHYYEGYDRNWFCLLIRDEDGSLFSRFPSRAIEQKIGESVFCSLLLSFNDHDIKLIEQVHSAKY